MGSDDIAGTVAPSLDRVQIRYGPLVLRSVDPRVRRSADVAITRCIRRSADVAPGRRSPGWGSWFPEVQIARTEPNVMGSCD